MSEKKTGIKTFLIIFLILVIIGVIIFFAVENNNGTTRPSFIGEEVIESDITDYHEYLSQNQDDKTNYYTLKIYEAIYDNVDEIKDGANVISLSSYFSRSELNELSSYLVVATSGALTCLTLDNPDLFWISFDDLYIYTESSGFPSSISDITFQARDANGYFTDFISDDIPGYDKSATIDSYLLAMSSVRDEIYQALDEEYPQGATEYQTIEFFNDYLVDTVVYDDSVLIPNSTGRPFVHTAYGALVNGLAVCDGYAYAMQYLLDGKDITNLAGVGYVQYEDGSQEGHAWNYVYLYGNWYGLDVTWNDGDPSDPTMSWEEILEYKELHKHDYFLLGGDLETGDGFYDDGRTPQNYIYYFDGGEAFYQFPIPKITDTKFVEPSISNVQVVNNDDGSATVNITVLGMQDNYSLAYAKSDDGLEYGDYLECDNVIHFIDNSDSGSYKFVLMSKDGEIICEYSEIVTIEVSTLVSEQAITIIEDYRSGQDATGEELVA